MAGQNAHALHFYNLSSNSEVQIEGQNIHAVEISLLQYPIVLEMGLSQVNTCPGYTTDPPAHT